MAERRMFTKKVTDDDNFMQLSASAQALYLHLSMAADDDGFCNQVAISMFKAHASVQDLKALLEARYIYQFENGVIVIKHWRMANALRKDRYTPTAFQHELSSLKIKRNGAYTTSDVDDSQPVNCLPEGDEDLQETDRQIAYRESSLPYSFDYKIRKAFYGKKCPICGNVMQKNVDEAGIVSENRLPTIQHNIPVSKGGKHELGNISVICHQCNVSIQDEITGDLNADEVVAEWEKLSGCRLVADCLPQDSIGKVSIGKDSIGEDLTGSKEPVCRTKDVRRIVEAWNTLGLNEVREVTGESKRGGMLRARVKEHGVDGVLEAIENVRKSDFLKGQNTKGFVITFDWFVKPNNFIKVLEGNYNDLHETGAAQKPKQYTTAQEYKKPAAAKTLEELQALVDKI